MGNKQFHRSRNHSGGIIVSYRKPIDKLYLLDSLKKFDNEILSKKYIDNVSGNKGDKGDPGIDGISVIVTERADNTEDCYRLDITNGESEFTTPNLMGVIGMEYKNIAVGTPVGEIISFMGTVVPQNYLICDGTIYQINDYPILAQHIFDNFGSMNYFGGDGETTFAVPDLRGEFLRGAGTNIHSYGGSGGSVGEHQIPTLSPHVFTDGSNITVSGGHGYEDWQGVYSSGDTYKYAGATTANFTKIRYSSRPTNTSVLYCIKYKPTYWVTPTNVTGEE